MVRDMMDHLTTLWLHLWEQVAAEVQIDHIHIWEDMSGKQGSLISPAMVERVHDALLRPHRRVRRAHGVRVISVDTDGDCSELVPVMMEHGVNMFLPFEVQAGNDILEYRRQYPDPGHHGRPGQARAGRATAPRWTSRSRRPRRMIEHGRYIPGFDHLIPPDVPVGELSNTPPSGSAKCA